MMADFDPKTHYRCAACRVVFEKGWSDDESLAEAATEFPDVPIEETDLVCDDCYKVMVPLIRAGVI